jgi:Lar family restriction alleviation protein
MKQETTPNNVGHGICDACKRPHWYGEHDVNYCTNWKSVASTLRNCPFCGGEPYYTESVNGSKMIYVGCCACGIAFKAQKIYSPTGEMPTKDVIAAWNQRFVEEVK